MSKIVTRFAPSPTGLLHLGNYRTAVFSYLYAKKNGGQFLLRIEDTDRARSKQEYTDNIIESLQWLGLDYDNQDQVPHQTDRLARYQECLEKLLAADRAYYSQEEVKLEDKQADRRDQVIRFRNPKKKVAFHDLIRGQIEMDTTDLGDFVIAKSLTEPIFHLAVVVDDWDMGITHVVRGEDHISNTPRQILIQEALGAPLPEYAHLPLVLAPDRTKLSKRKGALAATEYRRQGYLPAALLNFMSLLGWHPENDQEIFSKEELIQQFDLARVQKGGAIFDETKLKWFNHEHLLRLSPAEFLEVTKPFLDKLPTLANFSEAKLLQLKPVILERISILSELQTMIAAGDLDFFFTAPTPTKELLRDTQYLAETSSLIAAIAEPDFTADKIKAAIWDFATAKGRAQVLWPLRVALTGKEKSPDPFTVAAIIGKEETLSRLRNAEAI